MSDEARRLEAAKFAVVEASTVCRAVQRELERVRSITKDDKSPVTVADFASQAVVARALVEQLGTVTLVAEEDSAELRRQVAAGDSSVLDEIVRAVHLVWPDATPDEVLEMIDVGAGEPASDTMHGFWTLDPIDGTKGFLRGQQYAVSLAWIEAGTPVLGVLGCPNLSRDFSAPLDQADEHGTLYYAAASEGVCEMVCDDPEAEASKLMRLTSAEGEGIRMCESVEAAHTSHSIAGQILEKLGEPAEPARLDSQAKYAVVARGQADLYLRLPTPGKPYIEKIWDHAAGAAIASEAGCAVSDIFGETLDFSHGRGLEKNKGVVVGPPELHGKAIGAIRELGIGRE